MHQEDCFEVIERENKKNKKYALFLDKIRLTDWFDIIIHRNNCFYFAGNKIENRIVGHLYHLGKGRISDAYSTLPDELKEFEENCGIIYDSYEMFIERFFSGLLDNTGRFFIFRKDKKEAIFDVEGNRVSDWFDCIKNTYCCDLLNSDKDFFIGCNNRKKAIFSINGEKLSDWFDHIAFPGEYGDLNSNDVDTYFAFKDGKVALFNLEGERISDWYSRMEPYKMYDEELKSEFSEIVEISPYYCIAYNDKEEMALVDYETGKRVTPWDILVKESAFLLGYGDHYIAIKNGKEVIFDIDKNQVSDWFDEIDIYGLPSGESPYYLAKKGKKWAIFEKEKGQISKWYDKIYGFRGLIRGESDYFIATSDKKEAIFDKYGNQISEWFDYIVELGLVEGRSEYYIAGNKEINKEAIFHKSGKQISEWVYMIYREMPFAEMDDYTVFIDGIVAGNGNYYFVIDDGQKIINFI